MPSDNTIQGAQFTINAKGQVVPNTTDSSLQGAEGSAGGAAGRAQEGSGGADNSAGVTASAPASPPPATTGAASGASGDFSSMLGIYGLPPDVQNEVNQIFAQTSDVTEATALALAYVRGTAWYAQTYPGIQAGISNGLINNEADYRAYVNQIDQLSQQYTGQQATAAQIAGYITSGYNPSYVGNLFQGQATVAANSPQWQYESSQFGTGPLTGAQQTALGNEKSGIDTSLGQTLQNNLNNSLTRLTKAFNGVVATPQMGLGSQGLNAPQLAGQKQPSATGNADIAAI